VTDPSLSTQFKLQPPSPYCLQTPPGHTTGVDSDVKRCFSDMMAVVEGQGGIHSNMAGIQQGLHGR
jgi:hypothetical protein